jgi:hypothetical protein
MAHGGVFLFQELPSMPQNQLVRQAVWLQELWHKRSCVKPDLQYDWSMLQSRQELVRIVQHRLSLAQRHGLTLCQPQLRTALRQELISLVEQASRLRDALDTTEPIELDLHHWYQEVQQLHDEFEGVSFLKSDGKLRVETPSITLEEVDLGPFAIDFLGHQPRRPFSSDHFEIVALAPNPAVANRDYTHPHVQRGVLCAGEGQCLIRSALQSGRLADAFLLIQSILQTYNGGSAYVPLEKWTNVSCSDCLQLVDPEEASSCPCCGQSLCDHCAASCTMCTSSHCPGCLQCCAGCKTDCCENCLTPSASSSEFFCTECRSTCDGCAAVVGSSELDGDSGLCPECLERQQDDESPSQDEAALIEPENTIHA